MPADAGIKFGHYVLLRRIARGGMAEVFLAQQRGLEGFDRRVAVKRILPHLADSSDFVKMFLAEAKLAAQLSHPNIVHIYEFGKVDHDYFIAMEYVDGVHAGQLMAPETQNAEKLSPTLIARIGADAAAALNHAHELRAASGKPLGLVHRDVSPANIMLSYDGVVKLCDFGIAKAAAVSDQLTNPGQVKGKYAYMSPEQTVAQPLDGRSDVFALAIVLWELLAGRYMVPRGDAVVAMRTIRDGKIERLDAVAPATPRPLADAIQWALENRRDKRATAAELAQALEAFIKSSPVLATPMQLAAWVRQRFPREATNQIPALETPPGTVAAPGTVAGAATPASGVVGVVTPSRLIGASRVAIGDESSGPGPESGTSIFVATKDLIDADTLKRRPFPPLPNETFVDTRGPDAPTVMATANPTLRDSDTRIDAPPGDSDDDLNDNETIERSAAELLPPRPSPTLQLAPSVIVALPSGPRVAPSAGHAQLAAHAHAARRKTPAIDPARMRIIVAASGLVGLALISFLVALAAKGSRASTPAPIDAARIATVAPIADAAKPDAPIADAAAIATVPIDASTQTTEAFLEVSTFPPGGTVRVGDQSRVAPAQLVVQAGTIGVDAELDGYAAVHRDETVEAGEHRTVEIAFTHKLTTHGPALGKLTVRTSPYAEVFENGKKLGETPFADHELPAGAHVLTFKNPLHPTVTKKIVIQAGKVAKLNFDLP
ncbi:MAG TPA: protein kinase [Kofleriaceae bacterium]|nr:protein kinase [Kofleriaceae bacterium]